MKNLKKSNQNEQEKKLSLLQIKNGFTAPKSTKLNRNDSIK